MKQMLWSLLIMTTAALFAEEIQLPTPTKTGGKPLMEAIASRCSSRDFTPGTSLTRQELGDLLWCANGTNREGMRTAPSALNVQGIDIYVFDAEAVWLYNATAHSLTLVKKGDFRAATGMQPFVKDASINLLYVYDVAKWPKKFKNPNNKWASADAAFCAENVYLYCASAGLKVVVRGSFQEAELVKLLSLKKQQTIALAQSIGK